MTNTEQLIADTLADRAYLAPGVEDTLAGVHRTLRARRRTAVAVGASATAVAAVAVSVAAIGPSGHRAATQPAALPTPPRPTAASAARPAAIPGPDYTTVALGWLPGGAVTDSGAANSHGVIDRSYRIATADGLHPSITVTLLAGAALPVSNKRGTPIDLRIAGHPAREWSVDDWYHLALQPRPGLLAVVDVEAGGGKGGDRSAATLTAIGRRVAGSLQYDRHDPITTAFRLGVLPAGVRILGVAEQNGSTSYDIGPAGLAADAPVGSVQSTTQAWSEFASGYPLTSSTLAIGRAVQGQRTYELTPVGEPPVLWVDNIRPGVSLQLTGGPGVTTLAQLYAIADGLQVG